MIINGMHIYHIATEKDDDDVWTVPAPDIPPNIQWEWKVDEPKSDIVITEETPSEIIHPIPVTQEQIPQLKDPFALRGLVPSEHMYGEGWPWEDPKPGSPEWVAQHHTKEYLRGVQKPYLGYIRDPSNDQVTKATMDRLVAVEPEDYFTWGLRMRQELKPWMIPAAKAIIERNPRNALMIGLHKQGPEVAHLLPDLWNTGVQVEADNNPEKSAKDLLPGVLFNNARSLIGEISRTSPEFYVEKTSDPNSIGAQLKTKRFDNWAASALREKGSLGASYLSYDNIKCLASVADLLDQNGAYELATEIDNILYSRFKKGE